MSRFAWGSETKHKARESIMHVVLQFCTTREYRRLEPYVFRSGEPKVGDLVLLESVRRWTKWNIGWLREISADHFGCHAYVIESLEDGELCNWTNVGLVYIDRQLLKDYPRWQMTDRQVEFWERLYKEFREIPFGPRPANPYFDGVSVKFDIIDSLSRKEIGSFSFDDFTALTEKKIEKFRKQIEKREKK